MRRFVFAAHTKRKHKYTQAVFGHDKWAKPLNFTIVHRPYNERARTSHTHTHSDVRHRERVVLSINVNIAHAVFVVVVAVDSRGASRTPRER